MPSGDRVTAPLGHAQLLTGKAQDLLPGLPGESVWCCVTSPLGSLTAEERDELRSLLAWLLNSMPSPDEELRVIRFVDRLLASQLSAFQQDKDRLDWLESLFTARGIDFLRMTKAGTQNFREVIDAARAAEGGEHEGNR